MILLGEDEYKLICTDANKNVYRVEYCGCSLTCPYCGANVKKRDTRKRIYKDDENGVIRIFRVVCMKCKKLHSVLPYCVLPYKHYSRKVIDEARSFKTISDAYGNCFRGENSTIYRWRKTGQGKAKISAC